LSSPLSLSVKRLGQILRDGAEAQVGESESRLGAASETYWPLIRTLLVTDFKPESAHYTAKKIFGTDTANFAAVDGSEDQKLLGGLAVFWAGSYACTGKVAYHKDQLPSVSYDTGFVEKSEGLASCVPIYVDMISEVDPQTQLSPTGNQSISSTITEQQTVDNSTIANWIMLFSELYLAYKLAKSREYQIILLDYQTKQSLVYDLQEPFRWLIDLTVMKAFESRGLDVPDFYFTGDDYRYRFDVEAKTRFLNLLREQFNSGVKYKGRRLKWDTVIEQKTLELSQFLIGRSREINFAEPSPSLERSDNLNIRRRIISLTQKEAAERGIGKTTLYYLQKKAKMEKPFATYKTVEARLT